MNVRKFAAASVLLVPALATTAAAQVGHAPRQSPYTDLEYKQEATFFLGYYDAGRDAAGVAPQSGPMLGARYELRLGGPALLTSKTGFVSSQRDVIDPRRPASQRVVEDNASWPLYMVDVGIALNLTGQRSYNHLVPFVNGSIGLATDFKSADVGAYRFGTPFAISFGGGLKWVPSGKLSTRFDVGTQFYQIKYPSSYYNTASDGTSVLGPNDSSSDWTTNFSFTLGVSYLFFR